MRVSKVPPRPRTQTPPPLRFSAGLAGAPMKPEVWVSEAVFWVVRTPTSDWTLEPTDEIGRVGLTPPRRLTPDAVGDAHWACAAEAAITDTIAVPQHSQRNRRAGVTDRAGAGRISLLFISSSPQEDS